MRFERKYRIEGITPQDLRQLLRMHPASFRTLYPNRQISNIYFDSPNLMTFHLNVAGVGQRKKYRVRWYGEDVREIQNPRFEIKIKHNELGEKEVHSVDAFSLDNLEGITRSANLLHGGEHGLQPVLLNSYRRAYLQSMDRRFRLTIDWDLRYHSLRNHGDFHRYLIHDDALILEIKYAQADDPRANFITQHLPFRQSKHSKYVRGVELTL